MPITSYPDTLVTWLLFLVVVAHPAESLWVWGLYILTCHPTL